MNIESFRVFIDVFRHQSFAEVAKRKNVAPSSITRTISQLEDELGFRLFQRTTRKVSPTEEGEEFYKQILPISEELSQIKEKISSNLTESTLRITANTSFSLYFLNDIIIKFKKKFPKIKLEVLITDEYVDLVAERVDLAIRYGKIIDSSFIGMKLFDLSYSLCASPQYLKDKKITKPEDLYSLDTLALYISRYNQSWKFKKGSKIKEIQIEPQIKVKGAIPLIEYAKAGLGLTIVPTRMIEKELKSKKLVEVLSDYEMTPTDFSSAAWILYPSKEFVPTKLKLFMDFIKKEIT